jgi:uncharacterized UBP type Zn finger protein
MKKCLYCRKEIEDKSVIDFCEECGRGVFGDKMLKAIIENMTKAREKGDLYQGIISQQENLQDTENKNNSGV